MIFASPAALWLLPPALVLLWYLHRFGRTSEAALGHSGLGSLAGLEPGLAKLWRRARNGLRAAGLILCILALARPQQGLRTDERDLAATDILLCLDGSDSMRAEDFAPKTRWDAAKDAALRFIERRDQDRLGLVLFGQFAVTQCPLTTDRNALAGLLAELEQGEVPGNRTAIGDGLALAVERLKATPAKSKVIILLTDGVNNAGSVDPVTAAKAAQAYGIKLYAIGAGARGGGYMTVRDPVFGARRVQVAADIDEETMEKISTATGGKYFRATDAKGLLTIFAEIDRMEKSDFRVRAFTEYLERFEWLLLPGLLLIALEAFGLLAFREVP